MKRFEIMVTLLLAANFFAFGISFGDLDRSVPTILANDLVFLVNGVVWIFVRAEIRAKRRLQAQQAKDDELQRAAIVHPIDN